MTNGQRLALEQLREIESVAAGGLEILSVRHPDDKSASAVVELSLLCRDLPKAAGSLPLRERERFRLLIPPNFPFDYPAVCTRHGRFAGFPHVQWNRILCLYQAPQTEWDPSDGMFGFVDRLWLWLRQAAVGQLDPMGAPLHPPVTYRSAGPVRTVVPRADAPVVQDEPWYGTAHLRTVTGNRVDVIGWSTLLAENTPTPVGAAILLPTPMPFEFPSKVGELFVALADRNVSRQQLFLTLQAALLHNERDAPLYVLIGTPMRGIRGSGQIRQHLTAWYIDAVVVKGLRLAINVYNENPALREIGAEVEKLILEWADTARVSWCCVREDRSEIVTRRDQAAPVTWFSGRAVALWGCGALGGHAAEYLARAGVRRLVLRDQGSVGPGLLARQPFGDLDVGRLKVEALTERLRQIRPDLIVETHAGDLLDFPSDGREWADNADVIIETTASEAVLCWLETLRRRRHGPRVPIVSMAVGHRAERGLVALARPTHSGGTADVIRSTKLTVCDQAGLRAYADEFWPSERHAIFQPEPGCSDATFIGSAADVAALAGTMLNLVAADLSAPTQGSARSHLLTQPHVPTRDPGRLHASLTWGADLVCPDPQTGYEVRIAPGAWREIVGWARRSSRIAGPQVETGGLLFGERDDALGVIWVSEVSGPPPDSKASPTGFVCGVAGTAELNAEKRARTRGASQYTGMWHTHPDSIPVPSPVDLEGMKQLVAATGASPPKTLLLIVGGPCADPLLGAFVFSRSDFSTTESSAVRRCAITIAPSGPKRPRVGLALSGGGSRAIAFHLGCLRALHDEGILPQVEVISAVSGGAVIAAMYAYSNDTFAEFETRVTGLLRRGLAGSIARHAWLSPQLLLSAATTLVAGALALGADMIRLLGSFSSRVPGISNWRRAAWFDRVQPPLQRWFSRTTAFERALRQRLFGERLLTDPCRDGLQIILNACELRTGTAFRFGSRESGCWRFGKVKDNKMRVASAVAASAAYPALLPALDRCYTFVDGRGVTRRERVILTDGGVFDNLGVTCLKPGRSEVISSNVFNPDYVVCCDAGHGQFSDHVLPYWWPARMSRVVSTMSRRATTATYQQLHEWVEYGRLRGFVLAYLGQQDDQLPHLPADLVRREEVLDYPTDFSPMRAADIQRLSLRGEQLTRMLLARNCPDV